MKKEKPEEVALPTVSKVGLEKVHEKQSEMAKKKPLLSPPSNVQLVSNLYRSTKALQWKEPG